jgi:hypothetical protein
VTCLCYNTSLLQHIFYYDMSLLQHVSGATCLYCNTPLLQHTSYCNMSSIVTHLYCNAPLFQHAFTITCLSCNIPLLQHKTYNCYNAFCYNLYSQSFVIPLVQHHPFIVPHNPKSMVNLSTREQISICKPLRSMGHIHSSMIKHICTWSHIQQKLSLASIIHWSLQQYFTLPPATNISSQSIDPHTYTKNHQSNALSLPYPCPPADDHKF